MKTAQVDVRNAEVVQRGGYADTLEAIVKAGFCPFCEEHLFKHHRQPIIYKSRHWLVTKNSWPYEGTRFHFLFIARVHVENTEHLSSGAWTDFHRLYRKLVKQYRLSGASLLMRSGDTRVTGATVNHLHAQLIVGVARTDETEPIKALVGFKR